ncbi:MAG: NIPSNAP family protein, partial [Chloroflexi bacterium]|nr:NIPSNAP family protein [Chloroflexota bacterium]
MIYENRIYKAVPGRLPDINARFANHTMGFFKQYEIGMMGFWTDDIGASNQLT